MGGLGRLLLPGAFVASCLVSLRCWLEDLAGKGSSRAPWEQGRPAGLRRQTCDSLGARSWRLERLSDLRPPSTRQSTLSAMAAMRKAMKAMKAMRAMKKAADAEPVMKKAMKAMRAMKAMKAMKAKK